MKEKVHVHPMQMRTPLLALLVIAGTALAGCSGGEEEPSPSSSTSTSSSAPTTNDIITLYSTTTISGTVTTVTTTTTKTATSSGETATPGPTPDISNVTVTPGSNSAVVVWEVTAGGDTVTSQAEYAFASQANLTLQGPAQPGLGPQSTTISGLSSCNSYKVRIAASVAGVTARTSPIPFTTTAGPALGATGVSVPASSIIDTRFTVQWTVAGPVDAKSHVEYGLTAALGATAPEELGTGAKTAILSGLTAGQTYNYKIFLSSPCGTAASPIFQQKTATVQHVDINNGAAAAAPGAGGVNSFTPGSTIAGPLEVKVNDPLVFDITNKDSAGHEFHITDAAGANISPSYSSGTITAGNTYHFPIGVTLTTIGIYHMKCLLHAGMDGEIDVTA